MQRSLQTVSRFFVDKTNGGYYTLLNRSNNRLLRENLLTERTVRL